MIIFLLRGWLTQSRVYFVLNWVGLPLKRQRKRLYENNEYLVEDFFEEKTVEFFFSNFGHRVFIFVIFVSYYGRAVDDEFGFVLAILLSWKEKLKKIYKKKQKKNEVPPHTRTQKRE